MADPFKRGSALMFASLVATGFLLGVVNLLIDPYGLVDGPKWTGINQQKPQAESLAADAKLAQVARLRPSGLILGNSRADRGLDPEHPGWQSDRVYNLGFPGGRPAAFSGLLTYARRWGPIREVVIDLDYIQAFNLFGSSHECMHGE